MVLKNSLCAPAPLREKNKFQQQAATSPGYRRRRALTIDRGIARFVLTGSSARKLRRNVSANLLPGRVSVFHLDPLTFSEYQPSTLEDVLLDGSLPGITKVTAARDREADLSAYVTTYLEEEIRAEAAVRNLGSFARFLELAAAEAGGIVNLRGLSSDVGVAHTTIAAYYRILEDCLIANRIEPLTTSATRKKRTRSDKYLLFDLGVRRLAAHEGRRVLPIRFGQLFEQWVGLELLRRARTAGPGTRIRFWRDPDGPAVDWVIDEEGRYTPIEVKWTETPAAGWMRSPACRSATDCPSRSVSVSSRNREGPHLPRSYE